VQFLTPAKPGRLVGHGRVVRRRGRIAHLAGELLDPDGTMVASAVATALIRSNSA
jgi:acyl-coenzyme A thioesterase PaaI-like protein